MPGARPQGIMGDGIVVMKSTIRKVLKKIIPSAVFDDFKYFIKGISLNFLHTNRYYCPICKNKIFEFMRLSDDYVVMWDKYQFMHSIFCLETFNYLHHHCPVCNSSDRNRLYALYFEIKSSDLQGADLKYNFLDVAPDAELAKWFKKLRFINYRSVDLHMPGVDDNADITDMKIYESGQFDIILCSHVLEHIPDDRKAMAELYRVLKPGGFAIIMVPIALNLDDDFENPECTTEADRWKYFGQNDHVRMYSKRGFVNKLEKTGFRIKQLGVDSFGEEVFEKYGINLKSILYVLEK